LRLIWAVSGVRLGESDQKTGLGINTDETTCVDGTRSDDLRRSKP
jgi:hypothetical protein